MGTMTTALQPPDEITRSLFARGYRLAHSHPLAIDTLVAAVLLGHAGLCHRLRAVAARRPAPR
jgi:hypothetical protein